MATVWDACKKRRVLCEILHPDSRCRTLFYPNSGSGRPSGWSDFIASFLRSSRRCPLVMPNCCSFAKEIMFSGPLFRTSKCSTQSSFDMYGVDSSPRFVSRPVEFTPIVLPKSLNAGPSLISGGIRIPVEVASPNENLPKIRCTNVARFGSLSWPTTLTHSTDIVFL